MIYIPGLGDHRARGQAKAVAVWRLYGVHGELERIMWHDGQPFEPKFEKLLQQIDGHLHKGHNVSLVAASAGASAALNVFAARKNRIAGVVLLCGKVHHPENMHWSVFKKNKAFEDAMALLPVSLNRLSLQERGRIMSVHPLADESVPVADTRINGAVERTIPVVSHFVGIAYGLTLYAPFAMKFLKNQAKKLG